MRHGTKLRRSTTLADGVEVTDRNTGKETKAFFGGRRAHTSCSRCVRTYAGRESE